MKKITMFILTAAVAVAFASCGDPAANQTGNKTANTNTAKTDTAPPTKEALVDLEKKAFEAWAKHDGAHFQGLLAETFVSFSDGKRTGKADEIKMINESKCEIKSHSMTEETMVPVHADAAVLVAKVTVDGTCDGQKIPSPMTSATLFIRAADGWKAAYHNETASIDPSTPQKAAPVKPAAANEKKEDAPKADEAKKDAVSDTADTAAKKKEADHAADGTDDLTKTLMAMESSGWEAWKAKEAEKLGSMMSKDIAFVDPTGMAHYGKEANLKVFADQKCEVKSIKLTDGKASMVTPSVAVLTFTGDADATCDGQKLGPVWGTAVYVLNGGTWSLAFHFESPKA